MKPKLPKHLNIYIPVGIFLLLVLTAQGLIIKEWLATHTFKWQTPLIVQVPLVIKRADVTAIISPVGKDTKKLSVFDVGAIADKIYALESSSGKNDGCTQLDPPLYNGYGWHQNSSEWKCYPNRETVREQVIAWLEQHIKKGDINTALCYYNQGTVTNHCTYAIHYESL